MAKYKTVYDCTGCMYYRTPNGGCEKLCHYALETGRCRVMKGKIVPAEKCFVKKVFFEEK